MWRDISFLFDHWSEMGVLSELLGEKGIIDLSIRRESSVEEAFTRKRTRRRHRTSVLQDVEKEIMTHDAEDVDLWRRKSGFKNVFSKS